MKLVKTINFILYIFIFNSSIKFTYQFFCDKTQFCSDCTICGKDSNIYCSCNFNNTFCKNEYNDNYNFLSDFLSSYDGCISGNDEFYDICGISDINLEDGINNTIQFNSGEERNILCYYNIKLNTNNNNSLYITLNKGEEKTIDLSLYFIYYFQSGEINVFTINDIKSEDDIYYYINKNNVERVSIYVSIEDAQNINDFSMEFYLETNSITTMINRNIDTKNEKKIIFIIIIGIIALLIILLIIFLIIKKYKVNKAKKKIVDVLKNKKEFSFKGIKSINKDKMSYLYNNELSQKLYYKRDDKNNCYKCTICQEDFKEGISSVITTKCNHKFHFICFKKYVEKNIIFPKCPNCNMPILNDENNLNKNLTNITNTNNSSVFESNNQITQNIHPNDITTSLTLEPHGTTTV